MNNFTVRTVSGIGFVLIMLAGLLVDKFLFAALVLFIMTVMMKEFYRMTIGEEYRTQQVLAIIAGCIMFVLVFLNCAFHEPHRLPGRGVQRPAAALLLRDNMVLGHRCIRCRMHPGTEIRQETLA